MKDLPRARSLLTALALLGAAGAVSSHAAAQSGPPSGTVEISQVQVAFLFSGNFGSGKLHFNGRTYEFTIAGLGIGGIGASRIEASGEVYGLKDAMQFPGVYGQARYGMAAGNRGGGELWLENPQGVQIHLKSKREGLALSLGADGIAIQMK